MCNAVNTSRWHTVWSLMWYLFIWLLAVEVPTQYKVAAIGGKLGHFLAFVSFFKIFVFKPSLPWFYMLQ